jgi:hypothetical protein
MARPVATNGEQRAIRRGEPQPAASTIQFSSWSDRSELRPWQLPRNFAGQLFPNAYAAAF